MSESRSGIIIVVEDSPPVLGFICLCLRRAGFTVLAAANPEEARRIEAEHPGPVDLLISDVVMFRTFGMDLAEELKARRPGMKVILIWGDPDNKRIVNYTGHFLQKPFQHRELLSKVREVLHAKHSTAA